MNKLLYPLFNFLLLASLIVTTSCGTDDDPLTLDRPSFVITGVDDGEEDETTVAPGETVDFTLAVAAPGGFNTLNITKTGGTAETFTPISRGTTINQDYTYEFSYTPTMEEAGETIVFDFQAVDEDGQDNVYTYTINVTEPELVEYEEELLYAPLQNATSKTWFSTSSGKTYTSNEVNTTQATVSDSIDFGYFYGQTRQASLASVANYPSDINSGSANWNVRHDTKLKKTNLESTNFFETTSATSIQQAFEDAQYGANQGQVTNLEVGDVIVFMTDPDSPGGSRYGMIHVSNIEAGAGSEDNILINVKVMPVL
jgi:hypothetical protein